MDQDDETARMGEELRERRGETAPEAPPELGRRASLSQGDGRRATDEVVWIRLGDLNELIRQAERRGMDKGIAELAVAIWGREKRQRRTWRWIAGAAVIALICAALLLWLMSG
jgi:hypothetical protein